MNTPGKDIPLLLQEYRDTSKKISNSVYQMLLYGKGITREEAFNMTYQERCDFIELMEDKAKAESGKLDLTQ